ncbi:hypothetical protein LB553_23595 [Mesorhizobium sp. CA8]|uniref:hypothetical protein n=1 Tax=Mesorhizobium sp. CA8 TaxID=2876637 RepID=UPI001CCF4387|nr:hypothetical protein [Mesorhizobium sp. CA8]MBZ9763843.1 hypothetical protein [Mesorhizobium sp. CA8]
MHHGEILKGQLLLRINATAMSQALVKAKCAPLRRSLFSQAMPEATATPQAGNV